MKAGSPIKSFIKKVIEETEDGLGDWELREPITLELSTIISSKAGAGLNIQVVNIGAGVKAEEIQKISMSISPKDEVLEARKKADIKEAKYQEELANKRVNKLQEGMHPFREEIAKSTQG